MSRAWVTGIVVAWVCACGEPRLGGAGVGFETSAETVDFGRVLAGDTVTRSVTILATGRSSVDIVLSAPTPFEVQKAVHLPGASQVNIDVRFVATAGRSDAVLRMTAGDQTVTRSLTGEGVAALNCTPSAACRASVFDLETATCVESVLPDGAACQPVNQCLEKGACLSGQCLGAARSCDDFNPCTADACSASGGCIHTAVVCPRPTQVCHQSVCQPWVGCTEIATGDFTPCGSVDCVTAHVCFGGACSAVSTPDGFPCAPATPCQGAGTCDNHTCVRPDAGVLTPAFTVPLDGGPPPSAAEEAVLLASQGTLYFVTCAEGAASECQLRSYTANGFERFTQTLDAGTPRLLFAGASVAVAGWGALASHHRDTGARQWSAQVTVPPAAVAESATGEWWVAAPSEDGGTALTKLERDGGIASQWPLDRRIERLAVSASEDVLLLDDQGGVSRATPLPDGGYVFSSVGMAAGSAPFLSTNEGKVFARHSALWGDGGTTPLPPSLTREVLSSDAGMFVFAYDCTVMGDGGCADPLPALEVQQWDATTGGALWAERVWPQGGAARLAEAALVTGGGLLTLTESATDAGTQSALQLFGGGQRLMSCLLPEGGQLAAGLFESGFAYVLMRRETGWRLEAYELTNIPLDGTGWPRACGVSGTRRERAP